MDTNFLLDTDIRCDADAAGAAPHGLTRAHLSLLHDQGLVSHLDYYLAGAVGQAFPKADPLCLISCALVSDALSRGHVCLDLSAMAGRAIFPESGQGALFRLPALHAWVAGLMASGCVGDASENRSDEGWARDFPMILDQDRCLYLARYYEFQVNLIQWLTNRMRTPETTVDLAFIQQGLDRCFAGQDPELTAGQRRAVRMALERNFLVISGGPGTGKTHVVGMIMALLTDWHRQQGLADPRILCMAPTGKAAARLAGGTTIHTALRPRPDRPGFVHGKTYPLKADLVIVDEASMVDMALMTRLFSAIPSQTRLILLGDKNQLSPVQAGAVFSDLCETPALENARAFLSVNFRSAGRAGIDGLARAVNDNDAEAMTRLLQNHALPDVKFLDTGNNPGGYRVIEPYLLEGYGPLLRARTPDEALDSLDRFRVLCAHNRGEDGTLQVNHLCEKLLRSREADGITRPFLKRIVMVTRNDYPLCLFNGDTGVMMRDRGADKVYFRQGREVRRFGMARMPAHEPAFAVTIHKSQGSEFDTVLILIPDRTSPVVTRQLLYTGITRARVRVMIAGRLDRICQAMNTPIERRSNLAAGLERKLNSAIK